MKFLALFAFATLSVLIMVSGSNDADDECFAEHATEIFNILYEFLKNHEACLELQDNLSPMEIEEMVKVRKLYEESAQNSETMLKVFTAVKSRLIQENSFRDDNSEYEKCLQEAIDKSYAAIDKICPILPE